MKRLFLDWLKKTNRFKAFFHNAGHYYYKHLNRLNFWSYVTAAFSWISTPEGNDYWYQCHIEWEIYCKKYLITHPKFYKKYCKLL